MTKNQRLVTLAVVASIIVINAWSLMRYPAPFIDEAWRASRAWAFIQTGRQFGPLDAGIIDRFEGHWTLFPWLSTLIQSVSLRFVAQPELLPLRILSLLFGFALLGAVYAIARSLYDWRHGILSTFLVSVSMPFLYSAHLARTDVIAATLGFSAIALHLNNRSARSLVSFLSGLCIGLAFEVHPHSLIYAPAIVALYFLQLGWSMFRRRHFWAFLGGAGVGLAFYATLHIVPYPETYLALNRLSFTQTHTPPILTLDPWVIIQAFIDAAGIFYWHYFALVPPVIWAVLVLAKRRSESDKTLLVLSGVLFVGATLLIRNKFAYYAILYTPTIGLMIAALMLYPLQQGWHRQLRSYVRPVLVWSLCFAGVLLTLYRVKLEGNGWQQYQTAQGLINQTVQPDDSIMSVHTYWLGLHDHVYYSWEKLSLYQRYAPGSTLEEALREFQPDLFIIDQHLDGFISDERSNSLYLEHKGLPLAEMEAFLNRYGTLVGEFDVEHYGPIRVYRITWEEETGGVSPMPRAAMTREDKKCCTAEAAR
jgi:hypothetical protein